MAIQRTGSLPCRGQRDTVTSAGNPVWDSTGSGVLGPPCRCVFGFKYAQPAKSYLASGVPQQLRVQKSVGPLGGHVRLCSLCG